MKRGKRWTLALILCLVVATIGAAAAGCGKAKTYVINFNSMGGERLPRRNTPQVTQNSTFPRPRKAISTDSGSSAGITTRRVRTVKPQTPRIST